MQATVNKTFVCETAHRLPLHEGLCWHLHGHKYKVLVEVTGHVDHVTDMVVDFAGEGFSTVEEYIKGFDHACLLHVQDPLLPMLQAHFPKMRVIPLGHQPTAESIALLIADVAQTAFLGSGGTVTVWETDKCFASVSWEEEGW